MEFTDPFDRYPQWVEDSSLSGPELQIHIFGPYRGDYFSDFLLPISDYLKGEGYDGAKTCSELPNHPSAQGMGRGEKNWWESVFCMQSADAAIFIIADPDEELLAGEPAVGLNSSVIAEFVFWCHFFAGGDKGTFVIFEGDMSDKFGSLISGLIDISGVESEEVPKGDIKHIKDTALTKSLSWAWELK